MSLKLIKNDAERIKKFIDQAMNDWPDKVINYQDFLEKIKILLNIKQVDKLSIVKFMNTQNTLKFAWVFESLESLLGIEEFEKNILEEIVEALNFIE